MTLHDKKILVTGGEGFLGSFVVEGLLARGVPQDSILIPRSVTHDLRQQELCRDAVRGIDLVVHAAGVTGGVEFHKNHPGSIFYDNLVMGVHLMEEARRAGVQKFLTIGSVTEYPGEVPLPLQEDDLWKGKPDGVHGPYAVAKSMLLVQAESYRSQYGFGAVHLLLASMYGPREKEGFVIPSLIERMRVAKANGEEYITAWGTGKPTRDFLYVEDAAEGIVRALASYDKSDPVNLASGREISIRDLAAIIAKAMDFTGEVRFDPSKPDGQLRRSIDVSRAEREFGFTAPTPFDQGLKKTVEWHLEQHRP